MRKADYIFMGLCLLSICIGLALPGVGDAVAFIPKVGMLVQLLLCFLASTNPQLPLTRESLRGMTRYLLVKMVLFPLIVWLLFSRIFPDFAFGALLLSGSAVDVMAPTLVLLVKGNMLFCVGAVIISSFAMSLSLPSLAGVVSLFMGQGTDPRLWLTFLQSGVFLFFSMLIPFCLAKWMWARKSCWAEGILARRFSISLSAACVTTVVIFSCYSAVLRANSMILWQGIVAVFMLAVVLWALGSAVWRRGMPEGNLSRIVGVGTMNNFMVVIIAMEFFGPHEVILAALYSIPFSMMVLLYQANARQLRGAS